MLFCGKSDVGMRRQINQDSYRAISIWGGEALLLVVCDGMGGHKAGEVASRDAIEVFCNHIVATPCLEDDPAMIEKTILNTMGTAARKANAVLYELSTQYEEFRGMGTTLVACVVFRERFYAINIGDSRLYVVTKYGATQITKDHSFVQYLLEQGKITPEEAKTYPRKNVITNAVGVSEKSQADFFTAPLALWESGYLLLCSDGLTNYADEQILVDILCNAAPRLRISSEVELSKKVDMLIAYANAKGGSDNITAILAKF